MSSINRIVLSSFEQIYKKTHIPGFISKYRKQGVSQHFSKYFPTSITIETKTLPNIPYFCKLKISSYEKKHASKRLENLV